MNAPLQHGPHQDAEGVALRERARQLGAKLRQVAARNDRLGALDLESLDALRRQGLAALSVPAAFGGPQRPFSDIVDIVGELGHADPSVALILAMQLFHTQCIVRSTTWPAAVRERVLREVASTGALLNALRVEPEQGSPVRGGLPATLAVHHADGWRLSGRKLYSTGAQALHWGIVWAATDDGRIGEFLVPMEAPGVRIEETWDHAGLRASGSHDVVFTDVLLPLDHAVDIRLPAEWKARDETLNSWLPVLLAALYDGIARAAVTWWQDWIRLRVPSNLGASLATLPRFRAAAGEVQALLQTNAMLLWSAKHQFGFDHAPAHDSGSRPRVAADLLKYTVTQNAITAVSRAVEAIGNHGLSRANPLERHLRDVLCSRIHQPQNDLILEGAGGRAFAASAA